MGQSITNLFELSAETISQKVKGMAFEALFENLPVAFFWMDRDGYFLGCNDVELEICNLKSLDEFIGKHSDEVCEPDAWQNSKIVMETGQAMTLEEAAFNSKGEKVYYLSIKSPIQNNEGKIIGLLGIAIDITERKKVEEELRIAKAKAEVAAQAKSQFLAVTSHELRVPLTGIIGLVGLMKEEGLTQIETTDYINSIESCSTHLLSIVNDILDFAKLEADKFQLVSSPLDFRALIEEVIGMLIAPAKEKGLDLLLEYPPDVPSNIFGDARALRQVLVNLLGNAIKFTEKGFIKISVKSVDQNPTEATLEVSVHDTGKGIPLAKQEEIFDHFTQIRDTYIHGSSHGGTGLGLAITKKLVTLMDGSLHVESELGKGSRFYFVAKFLLQQESNDTLPWSDYAMKVRVLIVDDTHRGRVLCNNIGDLNCEAVLSSEAISEIISAAQLGRSYQVVVIDQQLCYQTSISVLNQIIKQKNLPKIMSLLLIDNKTKSEKNDLQKAGFFEILNKPIQPIAFQVALTSAWERWIKQN